MSNVDPNHVTMIMRKLDESLDKTWNRYGDYEKGNTPTFSSSYTTPIRVSVSAYKSGTVWVTINDQIKYKADLDNDIAPKWLLYGIDNISGVIKPESLVAAGNIMAKIIELDTKVKEMVTYAEQELVKAMAEKRAEEARLNEEEASKSRWQE